MSGGRSFVGRGEELAAFAEAIGQASGGHGRALLIGGPPGIGKSRLLDQVEKLGSEHGAEIHRARCWEEGGAPAFWPWVQIVRSIEGAGSLPLADAAASGAGAMASAEGRFATFTAIAEILTRAAKSRPRIVIVDDLHAADPASVVMLQFVATAIRGSRVLAVGAYRDTEVAVDAAQAERFAELGREVATIHLQGLGESEVAQWFGERLGVAPNREVLEALVERTDGNPLFVDGIFRSVEATGGFRSGQRMDLRQITLPAEIDSAVRGWVGRLSEGSRPSLQAASVIGIEFEVDLLVAVTGRAVEEVLDALSEAAEVGVLAPDSRLARRRRFTHTMIHDALYRSLAGAERRRLDHRIARELGRRRVEDDEVAVTRIAHQLIRSVESETAAETLEYALEAAGAAERRHADGDAARLLQHAVDVGRRFSLLDDERTAELLLEVGRRRFQAGDRAAARVALRDAFELGRRVGRIDVFARAAIEFVGPTAPVESDDASRKVLEEALTAVPESEKHLRARLLLSLAHVHRHDRHRGEMFASALEEAKAIAGGVADPALDQEIVLREIQSLSWNHDVDAQRRVCERASALVRDDGSREAILTRALLVRWFMERGMPSEENAQSLIISQAAEQRRSPLAAWLTLVHRSTRALRTGNLEAAGSAATDAFDIGRFLDPLSEIVLFVQELFASREHGRPREARAGVDLESRFVELTAHIPNSEAASGLARWLQLDQEAGVAAYRAFAASGFPGLYPERTQGTGIVACLAEFALEANDPAGAQRLLPWVQRWSDYVVVLSDAAHLCLGHMQRYAGIVEAVLERWNEAESSFRAAIERNEEIGSTLWANHARVDLAGMLARHRSADDVDRARHLLSEVRPWADSHGAKRLLRKIGAVEEALRSSPLRSSVDLGAAAEPGAGSGLVVSLRKSGDFWSVSDGRRSVQLKDSKGLRYLDLLLRHPRREFHATELIRLVHGDASDGPAGIGSSRDDGSVSRRGLGNAGEMLDARAVSELRERARELGEELAEARTWNDAGRIERAREELAFLEKELGSSTGLGGRIRRSAEVDERVRKAVTNRIRDAIRRISRELPDLGAHLARCVKTGASCVYDSNQPLSWDL